MKEQFKIQIRYLQEYTLLGEFIFYRIESKTYIYLEEFLSEKSIMSEIMFKTTFHL